jgi:Histone methylation protein DOT1
MNNHKIVMNQRQHSQTVVFPIHAGVTATATATATATTQKLQNDIVFVDLGSGDGRVVFRAAQEQLFTLCIGYEINPLLHLYALMQRLFRTMIRRQTITSTTAATTNYNNDTETQFYLRDLWNVNLSNANVVAVVCFFSCCIATIFREITRNERMHLMKSQNLTLYFNLFLRLYTYK